jgi:hypothetical protein
MSGFFCLIRVRLACLCYFATLNQFLRQFTLCQSHLSKAPSSGSLGLVQTGGYGLLIKVAVAR